MFMAACALPEPVSAPLASPVPAGAACLDELTRLGARFKKIGDNAKANACGIANAIEVEALTAPFNRPAQMDCDLALALLRFERDAVQPLAQQHFRLSVVRVHHAGAYVCRNETGGKRLSQHAFGKAIDILAYELEGGQIISVNRNWRTPGAPSAFLRDLAKISCRYFRSSLSPNTDAAHRDHFHFDIGPYISCGG